jgi:hypothetical protein
VKLSAPTLAMLNVVALAALKMTEDNSLQPAASHAVASPAKQHPTHSI